MGFMGSGKSTVGCLLADALGWRFVDLDPAIEQEVGREIHEIFREDGEETFRLIEQDMALRFLAEDQIVLAPGGGWPCQPRRLDEVGVGTLSVWLKVSASEAVRRVRTPGARRPLLVVTDPLVRAEELLLAREAYYARADWWVDTADCTAQDVVRRVSDRLRTDPDRPLRL